MPELWVCRVPNRVIRSLAILMVYFALATSCPAQLGIVEIPLAGKVVSSILTQFEAMATRLINLAGDTGNGLIGQAGEEVHLQIADFGIMLTGQQDKLFEQLDPSMRNALIELNGLVSSVNNLSTQASYLEQFASLDIQTVLNRIPLTHHQEFLVKAIRGYTLTSADNRQLTVIGLGIGLGETGQGCVLGMTIDGTPLPSDALQPGPDEFTLTVNIPPNVIANRFDPIRIVHLPVTLTCDLRHHGQSQKHNVNFDLLLLPITPGTMQLTEFIDTPEPDGIHHDPAMIRKTYGPQDHCDPDNPCIMDGSSDAYTKCLQDNQQIVDVRYECLTIDPASGNACGFSTSFRRGDFNAAVARETPVCQQLAAASLHETVTQLLQQMQYAVGIGVLGKTMIDRCVDDRAHNFLYAPDYQITNDNHCASVWRRYDSADAPGVVITYYIDYQQLKNIPEPHTLDPIPLKYGEDIVVSTSEGNQRCDFEAKGLVIFTNQTINIDQGSAIHGYPLSLISSSVVGNRCQLTFRLSSQPPSD